MTHTELDIALTLIMNGEGKPARVKETIDVKLITDIDTKMQLTEEARIS